MSKRRVHIVDLLVATFLAAAPLAHAELYKWTNDDGTTTYSSQPPEDPAAVQDLTKIETPRAATPAAAAPEKIVVETTPPKTESDAPRAAARSALPQAVQDPCLTSSDRYCHQKHSAHYRPYVGYTPEVHVAETSAIVPPARGGTGGTGAGGTASGGMRTK